MDSETYLGVLPFNDSVIHAKANGGSHWTLFVLDHKEQTLFHFDSLGRSDPQRNANGDYIYNGLYLSIFLAAFGIASNDANVYSEPCGRQHNDYDCGIHVIFNVDLIIE